MPVGFPVKVNYATGDILTATNMNDLGGTINLLESAQYAAGKNKIINGDFGIWQRGNSFTLTNPAGLGYVYGAADRYTYWHNGSTAGTNTVSQQTFTPGTAPVSGYEGTFFQRATITTLGTGQTVFDCGQRIEDVRAFAGQTITLSFWSKTNTNRIVQAQIDQNFGTGGSTTVTTQIFSSGVATTTSWVRYSATIAVPSISGKTIGTNSYLNLIIRHTGLANGDTLDIWGIQLEAASTASPFQTATGTRQGELAACQRYYFRSTPGTVYGYYGQGIASSLTNIRLGVVLPVQMRINPTAVDFSNLAQELTAISAVTIDQSSQVAVTLNCTSSGMVANTVYRVLNNNNTAGFLGFSAELQEMTMDKVTFIKIEQLDGLVEHAIIDHGNGEFTSMTKAHYDSLQAELNEQEVPAKK